MPIYFASLRAWLAIRQNSHSFFRMNSVIFLQKEKTVVFWKKSMADQFSYLVKIALVAFLITLLWAASVAFTYWDTHHQRMASGKTFVWLAVVAFLPFLGFIVYIFFRVLSLFLSSTINATSPRTRRVTALKPPAGLKRAMPTISASDLDMQMVLDPKKEARANPDRPMQVTKYIFTVSVGVDTGKEFIVESLPAKIGRGSEVSIQLNGDLGVSRKHADIYEQGGLLRIRDLNSAHGTQVNGLRIDNCRLQAGDRIQVGSTVLVVKMIKE